MIGVFPESHVRSTLQTPVRTLGLSHSLPAVVDFHPGSSILLDLWPLPVSFRPVEPPLAYCLNLAYVSLRRHPYMPLVFPIEVFFPE